MNPYLDIDKNPRVSLIVKDLKSLPLDAFIDTGFTGGIAIPIKLKHYFQVRPGLIQRFILADGSVMTVQLFEFMVNYKNNNKLVSGFFTSGKDALVGIEFLKGFKFILDLKKFTISLD